MNSENFSDFIKIIITVVIVLLLGAAAFAFWAVTSGFIGKATQKVADISVIMDESDYTQYEGVEVSGTEVIAAIKNFENEEICITVENGRQTGSYIYDDTTLQTPSTLSIRNASKKSSDYYINPNSKYLGEVQRDSATGGTIVGLKFTVVTTP